MKPKQKIEAFTLIETLGAMVIGSIIIGAAYFMFSLINSSQFNFIDKIDTAHQVNVFYENLNYSIHTSDSIKLNDNQLEVYNQNHLSIYSFNSSFLSKGLASNDTLRCILNSFTTETLNENNFKINVISLDFNYDNLNYQWLFEKDYGSILKLDLDGN